MQLNQFLEQLAPFIRNHWMSFLGLLLIIILIIINEMLAKKNSAKTLSPQEVVDLINNDDAFVLDLRETAAFRTGHIIHAINISIDTLDEKRVEKYKTKPIILVCARGIQSTAAAEKLRKMGIEKPMILAGGMASWEASGLPLSKGKA